MSGKQPSYMKNPNEELYATEYAGRHPAFKVHKTLGHARLARANHGYYQSQATNEWQISGHTAVESFAKTTVFDVYRLENGQWVHMPEESRTADHLEYELVPVLSNGWAIRQAQQHGREVPEPIYRDRVQYRLKQNNVSEGNK